MNKEQENKLGLGKASFAIKFVEYLKNKGVMKND